MNTIEAIHHYIPHMEGWSDPKKCQQIAECIMEVKPELSFEIGIFAGRGLTSMAMAHREIGVGKAIGIDPWRAEETAEGDNTEANDEYWANMDWGHIIKHFTNHLDAHRLLDWCDWWRMSSQKAIYCLKDDSIGVMHQDGNHSEDVSMWEVMNYADKIQSGGYWVMDDVGWETTEAAQYYIENKLKWKMVNHDKAKDPEGDFQEWKIYQKA